MPSCTIVAFAVVCSSLQPGTPSQAAAVLAPNQTQIPVEYPLGPVSAGTTWTPPPPLQYVPSTYNWSSVTTVDGRDGPYTYMTYPGGDSYFYGAIPVGGSSRDVRRVPSSRPMRGRSGSRR